MTGLCNRHRGDVVVSVDGRPRTLRLTLGGLAELETAFAVDDLVSLVARLSKAPLGARDICLVLAAGFSGGGERCAPDDVATMTFDDGPQGAVRAVSELLTATFAWEGHDG